MNQMITVVLRLIHIVSGVSWAGAVFLMVGFIYPSMRAVGPQGGALMQQFQRRRLPVFMNGAAGLTILSGFILYGRAVAVTDGAWARTTSGMVFGLGGVATLLAAIIGGVFVSRSAVQLAKIGESVQAAGGRPSPEQAAELGRLQARMGSAMRAVAGLLIIAVMAMATARYL